MKHIADTLYDDKPMQKLAAKWGASDYKDAKAWVKSIGKAKLMEGKVKPLEDGEDSGEEWDGSTHDGSGSVGTAGVSVSQVQSSGPPDADKHCYNPSAGSVSVNDTFYTAQEGPSPHPQGVTSPGSPPTALRDVATPGTPGVIFDSFYKTITTSGISIYKANHDNFRRLQPRQLYYEINTQVLYWTEIKSRFSFLLTASTAEDSSSKGYDVTHSCKVCELESFSIGVNEMTHYIQIKMNNKRKRLVIYIKDQVMHDCFLQLLRLLMKK